MQNVDPKDRPKLFALIGAAVVVFGIVIFVTLQSIASVSPPPHPPASPTPPPVASGGTAALPGGKAAPGAPGAAVAPGAPGATGTSFIVDGPLKTGRDPFAPVPDDRLAEAAVRVKELFPEPKATPAPILTSKVSLPTIPFAPGVNKVMGELVEHKSQLDSLEGDINKVDKTPSVEVLPLAPPPYVVSGVLIGEPSGRDVAILRSVPGGDRRFVVVGEKLDGGFTVTSISADGVRVRSTAPGATGPDTILSRQPDQSSTMVTLPLGGAGTTPTK